MWICWKFLRWVHNEDFLKIDWLIDTCCFVSYIFENISLTWDLRQFQNCKITPTSSKKKIPKQINAFLLGGTEGLHLPMFLPAGYYFSQKYCPLAWLLNWFKSCFYTDFFPYPLFVVEGYLIGIVLFIMRPQNRSVAQ